MTKTSKLADIISKESNDTQESKKKIVFEQLVTAQELCSTNASPRDFKNVILLSKGYSNGKDVIMAYNDMDNVFIYIGQWNGGVV